MRRCSCGLRQSDQNVVRGIDDRAGPGRHDRRAVLLQNDRGSEETLAGGQQLSLEKYGVERPHLAPDPEQATTGTNRRLFERPAFGGVRSAQLRHDADAADADVDDLDRARLEAMTIFSLMRRMKGAPDLRQPSSVDRTVRQSDLQLVALADVA